MYFLKHCIAKNKQMHINAKLNWGICLIVPEEKQFTGTRFGWIERLE
jgi:hypothetical protein